MHHFAPLILAILIPVLFLGGCGSKASDAYHKITPEAGKEMIAKGVPLIDVREPSEYKKGHIPGAKNIPLGNVVEGVSKIYPDKKAPLIVYCRSGARSKTASFKLTDKGYEDVRDMGGILDWPYEIEK